MQILLVGALLYGCVLSVNSDWAFNPNYERSQLVGYLIEDEDSSFSPPHPPITAPSSPRNLRSGRSKSKKSKSKKGFKAGWGWPPLYKYIGYPKGYFSENGHKGGWNTYPYNYHTNFGKGWVSGWEAFDGKPLPPSKGWKGPESWGKGIDIFNGPGWKPAPVNWGWLWPKKRINIKIGFPKLFWGGWGGGWNQGW